MSPYPAQVDQALIVDKARELIERDGVENLTLAKLAAALNIKAPSLYKHVASRAELLKAVNTITARQIKDVVDSAVRDSPTPREALLNVSTAYRVFALENPAMYTLLYENLNADSRPDMQLMESIALPLQALISVTVPAGYSLEALRGALALLHGFVTLELNGQFQRGGNIELAFNQSIRAYLDGWSQQSGLTL
jgi:AcrR family transcriptional regulator